MRSDLIYDALDTVRNRYLLCQLLSKATRKFHKPNTRVQETMNDVLVRVGQAPEPDAVITLRLTRASAVLHIEVHDGSAVLPVPLIRDTRLPGGGTEQAAVIAGSDPRVDRTIF